MHLAHDAGQHGAVAHAGVEHAHRGRLGMQVAQLHADAAGDHLLLAAGVDEQQVLLPVVEEAEVARRSCRIGAGCGSAPAVRRHHAQQRLQLARRGWRLDAAAGQVGADPLQRLGRDAGAVAQPRRRTCRR